ncbi:MAG: hypothetical protein AB8B79_02640 [Granulosicoccus sp.]
MKRALILVIVLSSFSHIAIADWTNFWSTPEQRAKKAFESGDHETLLDQAPDENWKGLGQFQSGDYDAASKTFSKMDTSQALYNQAVSDVMSGRYQEALANFDTLLADDPEFTDAAHNREIVQQLIELQEQQQQQQQPQQGEQGDGSEQSQDQGEQQQDQQQSQDGQQGQQSDESSQGDEQSQQQGSEQNSEQSPGNDGNQESDSENGETQTDAEQAAEDARQALAAEAQQGEQNEDTGTEQSEATGVSEEERPLTESEQATEQWLRRIPDDPAGLLRRKLEQSHRNEFPEVRDAIDAW